MRRFVREVVGLFARMMGEVLRWIPRRVGFVFWLFVLGWGIFSLGAWRRTVCLAICGSRTC